MLIIQQWRTFSFNCFPHVSHITALNFYALLERFAHRNCSPGGTHRPSRDLNSLQLKTCLPLGKILAVVLMFSVLANSIYLGIDKRSHTKLGEFFHRSPLTCLMFGFLVAAGWIFFPNAVRWCQPSRSPGRPLLMPMGAPVAISSSLASPALLPSEDISSISISPADDKVGEEIDGVPVLPFRSHLMGCCLLVLRVDFHHCLIRFRCFHPLCLRLPTELLYFWSFFHLVITNAFLTVITNNI